MVFSTSITAATSNHTFFTLHPSNPFHFSKHNNTNRLKFPINNNNGNESLRALSPSSTTTLPSQSVARSQTQTSPIAVKLNRLASEFGSLTEPIERVKRLLHYAAMLPPLTEVDRVPENRVAGCSTQVWVVSGVDAAGRMRFRADSDSEISKGFCWCLVWALDGAEPHEVLRVDKDALGHVDVLGLGLKAQSRVNTWHNVLFRMQQATRDLVMETQRL